MEKQIETDEAAFTLVEVVIAAAVLALALTMVLATFVALKGTAYNTSNRLDALHAARHQMEKLMIMPYDDLDSGLFTSSCGRFAGEYTVETNVSVPELKEITLTICWTNPGSRIVSSNTIIGAVSRALH